MGFNPLAGSHISLSLFRQNAAGRHSGNFDSIAAVSDPSGPTICSLFVMVAPNRLTYMNRTGILHQHTQRSTLLKQSEMRES